MDSGGAGDVYNFFFPCCCLAVGLINQFVLLFWISEGEKEKKGGTEGKGVFIVAIGKGTRYLGGKEVRM